MAITDAYATFEEYQATVRMSDDADEATIERQLEAMSRFIEREVGQFFNLDASAVARVYVPYQTTTCLTVDPIGSVSGLEIKVDTNLDGNFSDETAWSSSDYQLRPLNADKGPEVRPWTEIYVPSWSSQGAFVVGVPVQVTAKFGWPVVPKAIVEAVIELTAIWRTESARATGRINELDQIVNASPVAVGLVRRLRDEYWMPVLA